MRALVIDGPGSLSVKEVDEPSRGAGEALVEVLYAGVCGTDLELSRGYMDFAGIPGHEFVGTVLDARSPADQPLTGARVVGEINIGCDDCPLCLEGMARHCPRREVLGILGRQGAFAERLTLPVSNLRAVPDEISDRQAVFVEPVAAACEILDQIAVPPKYRTLVLGDGRMGIIIAQVLNAAEADVTLAGHNQAKMAIARSVGVRTVRSPGEIPAEPYDLVVETTGTPEGLDLAVERTRPRGTVVMKSTCAGATTFDASRVVVNEVTLVGSRCGRFEPAIKALQEGTVNVDPLISATYPLGEADRAFTRAAESESLKVLLRVGE